jgi:hypothetical protein
MAGHIIRLSASVSAKSEEREIAAAVADEDRSVLQVGAIGDGGSTAGAVGGVTYGR